MDRYIVVVKRYDSVQGGDSDGAYGVHVVNTVDNPYPITKSISEEIDKRRMLTRSFENRTVGLFAAKDYRVFLQQFIWILAGEMMNGVEPREVVPVGNLREYITSQVVSLEIKDQVEDRVKVYQIA